MKKITKEISWTLRTSAQERVEHYEIAGYGTVRAIAESLGETEHVEPLTRMLDEEKETDENLTSLAEEVNSTVGAQGVEDDAEN